jgi:hypothetical protein
MYLTSYIWCWLISYASKSSLSLPSWCILKIQIFDPKGRVMFDSSLTSSIHIQPHTHMRAHTHTPDRKKSKVNETRRTNSLSQAAVPPSRPQALWARATHRSPGPYGSVLSFFFNQAEVRLIQSQRFRDSTTLRLHFQAVTAQGSLKQIHWRNILV